MAQLAADVVTEEAFLHVVYDGMGNFMNLAAWTEQHRYFFDGSNWYVKARSAIALGINP